MACVVVNSLLGIVEQLQLLLLQKPPHNNPCFTLPDDAQIILSTLKEKLHFLQAYLDKPKTIITSDPEAVKRVDKEIRDVAIKAEDEMESKLGEIYQVQGEGEGVAVKACEDLHRSLQQVVKDIECVEVLIRDHLQQQITLHTSFSSSSSSSKYDSENITVGVEDDVEQLKHTLLIQSSSSTQLQFIPIFGMPGTGMTTLAKRAYEDPLIVSHFDIRAWTVASRPYSRRKLLVGILGCIVSLTTEISNKDDNQLAEQLCKILTGQRYLIVIDNLRAIEALDEFKASFPPNSNGSRVLITTSEKEVFGSLYSGMCNFQKRFLNPEESWNLLSKTACNGKYCPSQEIELIGRRIVMGCRGIPLVIVLIGGLLATLNNSPKQWEDIEAQFNIDDNNPFRLLWRTIELCYNYLPTYLKACFLYLGCFPDATEIHVKKLVKLWIAEGFLKPEMNKSSEEIAEGYLCDLINRRLVQVYKRSLDGKIKSCMLNDSLYEFCFQKAYGDEENILRVSKVKYNYFLGERRWVSIQDSFWPITPNHLMNSSFKIRSLLYFGEDLYLAKCWFIFSPLKLLRVLDLSLLKYWHGMPSEIVDLVHLRYLALTTIGSLYSFQWFKLQQLQTLILSSWAKECQLQLPCNVLDLPRLRHVRYGKGCSSYLPNMVQENLQTLSWFKVTDEDSRTTNFLKVPNLKELGIYIEGEVLPNALDSLAQLCQLEKLKVKMGRVERFNLPNSFPSNLKQLTLSNTYLSWEDMDIIGNLPHLDLLKLKDFSFCGPEWTPKDGEFLQLRFFLIERSDLEHWYANANHFPALERLILRYCWDLEKLPNDFGEVFTLQLIELANCCSSLITSAKEIQQAQRDLGYEGLVVRDATKVELPTNESSGKKV
ncbi:putative late blight resistance protein homolog R1B-17 isoform X2 [Ipomoea triloba]|uniref:putative late blight resistance protein homolog R1B-17 isoform X2 n=1 Tax=Ipomoea triloba TaxID=35885 RepID=UPI00125E5409|nr:putative late blight resistance protein homolog R1B-17 isoform X2 [Ipomoea triloba]